MFQTTNQVSSCLALSFFFAEDHADVSKHEAKYAYGIVTPKKV